MNHSCRFICGFVFMVLVAGCTRTSNSSGTGTATGPAKATDPWPKAVTEIARTPDITTARRVLNQLNGDLSNANVVLPAFSAEAMAKATPLLNPGPEEARDWGAATFTAMDANFLGESLFFHAVARSLGVDGLPVDQQAATAFNWVCRQVYDRQWLVGAGAQKLLPPSVPPQFVLQRGYGVGNDREMVFLALARQLGLDAVLLGAPGNEKTPRVASTGKNDNRGPFWAVGVRNGDDVLLFDPWVGAAIPTADGKSILTLSAAKANPKIVTDWLTTKKSLQAVTAESIAGSICYLTVPVNALPPRMKLLEDKLAMEAGVKLFVNPDEVAARCAKLPGGPPKWYGPPVTVDPYTVPHALGTFLPVAEGGYDTRPAGTEQLAFLLSIEPMAVIAMTFPRELKNEAALRQFSDRCYNLYKQLIVDSGIRERIQRGQFNEAVRQLNELDRTFTTQRDRVSDPQVQKSVRDWFAAAVAAYEKLSLSRLPENAGQRPEAEIAIEELWKNNPAAAAAVQGTLAQIASADVAYWQALTKHEQAERSQLRYRKATGDAIEAARGKAAGDWAVARDEWTRCLDQSARFENAFPGRAAHGKALASRAAILMANPDAK